MHSDVNHDEISLEGDVCRFLAGLIRALGWEWRETHEGVSLTVAEADQATFGADSLLLLYGPGGDGSERPLAFPGTLLRWLHSAVIEKQVLHAAPLDQPTSVHEISGRLFDAYHLQDGNARLVGYRVEHRPLLRLTCWKDPLFRDHAPGHRFLSTEGTMVEDATIRQLGLSSLAAAPHRPKVIAVEINRWLVAAGAAAAGAASAGAEEAASSGPTPGPPAASPLGRSGERDTGNFVTVIWCTHVEGKIEFDFPGATDTLAFSEWAKPLADGSVLPPPFRCKHTGQTAFEIAATDDGRVTIPGLIGTCAVTGRHILARDLRTCSVTRQQVAADQLVLCPVSGDELLPAELVECQTCRQAVSPNCLRRNRCQACNSLRPIRKDDPRMGRLLGEHPQLDRWRRWRMAETSTVYVLIATSLYRRLLLVVDKDSLEVQRVAVGSRFTSRWVDAPVLVQDEYS